MGAFEWITSVVEWLGKFIPRYHILDTTEGAIKYRGGKTPIALGPGVHWYWPFRSTFVTYPIERQTDRLETQKLESKDGKTFMVSGTITYAVDDIMALVPRTHSPMRTVIDLAATTLHDVLCDLTWEEMNVKQRKGTIKTDLKNEAQKLLKEYGVRVILFKLNSLARCRVLAISQSTASEEN